MFMCEAPNPTSSYPGVSWIAGKWQAELLVDQKKYYCGLFDNEKDASTKINNLRDKLCMELSENLCAERKNPINITNLNEPLQVTHCTIKLSL